MSIWKSNDIRAKYPDEMDNSFAFKLGGAIAKKYNPKKVVIAIDMRSSSKTLAQWLYRGIVSFSKEIKVECLGEVPSPVLYALGDGDVNVMVTASHNPEPYNGFKICLKEGVPLGIDNGLHDLKNVMKEIEDKQGPFFFDPMEIPDGNEAMKIYAEKYLFDGDEPNILHKRIFVVDCSNSVGVKYLPLLREKYPDHIWIGLNEEIGMYSHPANPLMDIAWDDFIEVKRKILSDGLDVSENIDPIGNIIGIMFDGDGDRVGFYGVQRIPGDALGGVYIKFTEKSIVAYDTRCNHKILKYLMENEITHYETKVGHTFVKQLMREKDVEFGMELSGHYYFKEHNYCDAPLLMVDKIVECLSLNERTLDKLCENFWGVWATEELNYHLSTEEEKDMVSNNIANLFDDVDQVSHLHGVKVYFKDGSWVLSRKSGTEPVLRIIVEGTTKSRRDEIHEKVHNFIYGLGGVLVDTEDTREDDKLMEEENGR